MKRKEIYEVLDKLIIKIYLLEVVQGEELQQLLAEIWMTILDLKNETKKL